MFDLFVPDSSMFAKANLNHTLTECLSNLEPRKIKAHHAPLVEVAFRGQKNNERIPASSGAVMTNYQSKLKETRLTVNVSEQIVLRGKTVEQH